MLGQAKYSERERERERERHVSILGNKGIILKDSKIKCKHTL